MIKKIALFFIYSSENPQKISLTLKGFIPFIALFGLSSHVSVEDATGIIDGLVALLVLGGQFVAGAVATLGLIRKVYNTFSTR